MRQRILVHGADNYVGRRLVARLAAGNWAEALPVRTLDLPALRAAAATAQAAVHCLTGEAQTIARGATAFYNILDGAAVCRVVHLGSMSVYGTATGMIDEDCALRADLGPYSVAHRDAEQISVRRPDTVILRPGVEYGPDCPHWTRQLARLLLTRRLGDLGAAGDGCCNLLYIDDLLSAIEQALRLSRLEQRCFNVAAPAPGTWNDYLVSFALALDAVPVRRVGRWQLRLETTLLAPALKLLGTGLGAVYPPARHRPPPIISPSMLRTCAQDIRLDTDRAQRTLGLHWTDLQTGLQTAAAWCRASLRRWAA